ncbi:hypothetical protein K239x_51170 [Planctomycetes bacterium K23_9]|uniref:Uncharacterized protein n=1 Tax=Stieleria marina TaxID=1930275 RepID=A0A517P151_9BACT|nr:hypothetical protein K239x_51170 [Planctomycetes bacterium K23_9]
MKPDAQFVYYDSMPPRRLARTIMTTSGHLSSSLSPTTSLATKYS